ncbi:winged helix-turn-helix transcriptional regulator [Microbacterium sp. NPDC057407]|uniref:winged helix-turn-helix transcriptional regulator n=1 Tax=Microbacterium sp. NPDC057407 TaxID=3346120 RepID=UPI00366C13FC
MRSRVIGTLGSERVRFTELQRHIPGISQLMLTLTLRQLQRDGLVARTVYAEVPPRVEYELTTLGGTLIELAMALADRAAVNYPRNENAREAYGSTRPHQVRSQAASSLARGASARLERDSRSSFAP